MAKLASRRREFTSVNGNRRDSLTRYTIKNSVNDW